VEVAAQRSLPILESPPPGDDLPRMPRRGTDSATLARIQVLWNHRGFLSRVAVWGLLLGTVTAFLIPTKYDSFTQLMPPDSDASGGAILAALATKGGDALGGYASNLLGVKSTSGVFIGILRSRTVEDALVSKFDLRKVYWVRRWEDARKELESRTYIAEDRKSGIITIRVRDDDPQRAKAMAQAYVDQLNIAVATLSTSSARREREFLESRLKAVKQELDKAAQEFSQFASKNTAINVPEQGKAIVEAAARLQGELIAAQAQREGLAQIYTANNARVRAAQANINELQHQLDKLVGLESASGSSPFGSPDGSPYPSIRQLPLLGVKYSDLFRQTKIQEAVYETLTKQYELAKVQEAKEIPTVKLLDPPNFPEQKASPHRTAIIVFVMLIALALGCIWLIAVAVWEQTDLGDSRKLFAMEVFDSARRDWIDLRKRITGRFRTPEQT